MSNRKVLIEAALNGAAGKQFQPGIPVTVDDIIEQGIECAKAGAGVIHVHAYDSSGQPCEDVQRYRAIIEGIKAHQDVVVYPTVALQGSAEERYAPLSALASLGLLEWGVVDPGSVNITHQGQLQQGQSGLVYQNPDAHIRLGLAQAEQHQWRPAYAIYEPGFARLGAAMASQFTDLATPIYRIMFSDNLLFGMPPSHVNLEFYASFLNQVAPHAPWMLSGLDANIEPLIPMALKLGAHIRVGLEDAPFGCQLSNLELVERCVKQVEMAGLELATANDL